jgi:hypothetical protein
MSKKTNVKMEKKAAYPVMGDKAFAKRTNTAMPKQVVQSAKPAAQKPKMAAPMLKRGSGKPIGKNMAASVAKKDCK